MLPVAQSIAQRERVADDLCQSPWVTGVLAGGPGRRCPGRTTPSCRAPFVGDRTIEGVDQLLNGFDLRRPFDDIGIGSASPTGGIAPQIDEMLPEMREIG